MDYNSMVFLFEENICTISVHFEEKVIIMLRIENNQVFFKTKV